MEAPRLVSDEEYSDSDEDPPTEAPKMAFHVGCIDSDDEDPHGSSKNGF